jgi:MoaA/NifB/PqqE/SkfB family radical SAM enzyme
MCSIWKDKDKKTVKFGDAKRALIKLRKNNFGTLQVTGGEPLLNPDVFRIIQFAKKLGFTIFLVTNGTLINEEIAKKLSRVHVDNVGISFHHHNAEKFEKITNHKKILDKVQDAIKYLKKEKIPTVAMFTISKHNKDDIKKTVQFINDLGVSVSFCLPIISTDTSYSLGGLCVDFTNDELRDVIFEIIHLKKKGFDIINNMAFLEDTLRFSIGTAKYYCLGGYKIFYLDWNLNFFPCMFKGKPIKINEVDFNFENEKCNECLFQCFREPSLFLLSKPLTLKLVLNDLKSYLRVIKSK